ncbi:MAG: sigma-70 family RNA polymerase sigma factor [Parabacteroides sp.]|nr:sigma-70 family RNA polymerase sigma factor [Parabacteroides sp.]
MEEAEMSFLTPSQDKKFGAIYKKFHSSLFFFINDILKNEADSCDALQETFIRIMHNMDKIEDIDSAATRRFVYTIAKNRALTYYQKQKINATKPLDEGVLSIVNTQHATEIIASADLKDELTAGIALLKPSDQTLLDLKYYQKCDDKMIAELYGIQPDAVRKRLERARLRLSSKIQQLRAIEQRRAEERYAGKR